ncbi:hypothetical protein [Dokdonella sp.]|uniref:hypothetical protein n=1 Tax=Dokdonella sp. TaxID=2291710 RepID=UPI002F4064F2
MTKSDLTDLITGGNGMLPQCPPCRTYDLDLPQLVRGDDIVKCRGCGELFTFAFVESRTLETTREELARTFPGLPLDPI